MSCFLGLQSFLQMVSIEPAMPFIGFAKGLYVSFLPPAQREKIEYEYRTEMAAFTNQSNNDVFIQERLTEWSIYKGLIGRPLLILTSLFLGALSDVYGRKPLLLLATATAIVETFMLNVFYDEQFLLPMYFLLFQTFIFNMMGGQAGGALSNAYLVDKFPDSSGLAFRLTVLIMLTLFPFVIGNNVSGFLFSDFGLDLKRIMLISEVSFAIAFFYILFVIPNIIPKHTETPSHAIQPAPTNEIKQNSTSTEEPPEEPKARQSVTLGSRLKAVVMLEVSAVKVIFKKRTGSKRQLLLLTILFSAISGIAEKQENEMINIYTQQAPFNWKHDEFRIFINVNMIAGSVGSLLSMAILKKLLKLRDTTIIMIGLFVNIIDVGTIALAPSSMFIYVGTLLCDGFVMAIIPAAQSFLSTLVANDEIGKVYAVFSVSEQLEALFQVILLQPIYYLTVGWFKSCIWYILVVLNTIAFCVMLWVHKKGLAEEKNAQTEIDGKSNTPAVTYTVPSSSTEAVVKLD